MRLTNNQIAAFAIFVMLLSAAGNLMAYSKMNINIAGASTTTMGYVKLCINRPPEMSMSCGSQAVVSHQYYCDVDAADSDNNIISGIQSLLFSDNTALFDINPTTGVIQFTPVSANVNNYTITLMVNDNSTCSNSLDSATLNLSVIR